MEDTRSIFEVICLTQAGDPVAYHKYPDQSTAEREARQLSIQFAGRLEVRAPGGRLICLFISGERQEEMGAAF